MANAGKLYDVSYFQIVEADALRAYAGYGQNQPVLAGRRLIGQYLQDTRVASWLAQPSSGKTPPAGAVKVASDLHDLGFDIVATKGTAAAIAEAGVPVKAVNKVKDGRPHIVDMLKAGEIQLVFTTVDETRTAIADSRHIRQAALAHRVTYYTSMAGCEAAVEGMKHEDDLVVVSVQDLHAELGAQVH